MINAIVFGLAVALISFICYWFFGNHHEQAGNSTMQNNEQHATVVVKGGYSPSTLILKQGVPAKVNFNMQDSTACLAHVVFEKLGVDKDLTKQKITTIEIPTNQKGEIDYACGMDMFHGKIIIK